MLKKVFSTLDKLDEPVNVPDEFVVHQWQVAEFKRKVEEVLESYLQGRTASDEGVRSTVQVR